MPHTHKLPDGRVTSLEQVIDKDSDTHTHTVDGDQTSAEKFGISHTHTFEGVETSAPIDTEEQTKRREDMPQDIEVKQIGGHVLEVKQEERNGVPVGLISGHIATFDVDRGNDQFQKGAFIESLQEHQAKRRQIRFKDSHGRTVGGFPIETVREDEKGLFGIAEVNLDVQQGREAFSLAKQGVLSDFSIGFSSLDDEFKDGIRIIKKAIVWEGSIVDEPMNTAANVIEVKEMSPRDLERALRKSCVFSKDAAAMLATKIKALDTQGDEVKRYTLEEARVLINLTAMKESL